MIDVALVDEGQRFGKLDAQVENAIDIASLAKDRVRALGFGTSDEPPAYVEQLARWSRTRRWTSRTGIDYLALIDSYVVNVRGQYT